MSVRLFAFNASIAVELKERIRRLALPATHPEYLRPLELPSEYQDAIFKWIACGKGSAIVRAVAGSGKTTTIVQGLRYIPQVDLGNVSASTFHSVGFGAVCKHLGMKPANVKADSNKVRRLLREGLGDTEYEMYGDFVAKLIGLAKGQGVGCLVPDTEGVWYELIQHHDLYLDMEAATEERAVEIARRFLDVSNNVAKSGDIDFDDQLYLPLLWRLRLWQNDVVVIDEAQDTNPVRRAIAKLSLRPGGRLIAVGDERQAIYGFTGASHDAMDLIQQEFNCVELPLTISYRCPRSVGKLAQTIVPYFEVAESAREGVVEWIDWPAAAKRLVPGDMVLCRNTAPLVAKAFQLIAEGTGCVVLGRDIGNGLVKLIQKQRAKGVDALMEKLAAYRDKQVAKFVAKGQEGKAEVEQDRYDCISVVVDNLTEAERTVPALIRKLESLFSDGGNVVQLSTAHKAKGRESRRVFILRPDLMPSSWARQTWQQTQEENLQYVAWTRAMEELYFINPQERKQ